MITKRTKDFVKELKAIAKEGRAEIIKTIAQEGSININGLSKKLNMAQSGVSQDVQRLSNVGIVNTKRIKKETYCTLNKAKMQQIGAGFQCLSEGYL